jgi:hypothetical protein
MQLFYTHRHLDRIARWVPLAAVLPLVAAACGSSGSSAASGTSTGTATSSASSSSAGGSGGSGGSTGHGGGSSTALSLPQFVHGAARVDVEAFPQIPLVVGVSGAMPDSVDVKVDGASIPMPAQKDVDRFIAAIDTKMLGPGAHPIVAEAKIGGAVTGMVTGSLVSGTGSLQFTEFDKVGPGYAGHLVHDVAGDALVYTWVSAASGKHGLYMNRLDGAFARLSPADVTINDPADEPLDGYTAIGKDGIGVVYRTPKPADSHWLVKLRAVDATGQEKVKTVDLTAGEAAFSQAQAGVDPGGYSGAWLHISPAPDPMNPPPVEVRFARWDVGASKLVGPITLDMDQPQPGGSTQGPQSLEPLAEIGMACNSKICLVTYTRDIYSVLVDLNIPKLFLAVVDIEMGKLVAAPKPVSAGDWDTQLFGHHLIAEDDGSFVLVYTANDTAAAMMPKSPCDTTLERDRFLAVKIDANGKLMGGPKPLFDYEGTREYPRIAVHPAGYALFWEDQRSECGSNGHIRMAFNVLGPDLKSLLDPYLEVPGSIVLPPEDPTLAVTGTSFVSAWSDNRHGMGLADIKAEIFFDTYWRK